MAEPAALPQDPAESEVWVRFDLMIPPAWKSALQSAATEHGVSMADIFRMALRAFLKGRYDQ